MTELDSSSLPKKSLRINLSKNRYRIWLVSGTLIFLSLLGLILCWLNPSIRAPLRPGLDFTGGTQIQLERTCSEACEEMNVSYIEKLLAEISLDPQGNKNAPNLSQSKVQVLDGSKSLVLKLPFLSAPQGQQVISTIGESVGPFQKGSQSIETIGPSLGGQLLRSSLISLIVAFTGIALYISFRYDRSFALLSLLALAHDLIIVCGFFAWFGLLVGLEIDSLFAVALLTIAGYSVNDTVVIFDRIREYSYQSKGLSDIEKIDSAVSATLTRTIYTSGTTLLPLFALIFFGGSTLFWFSIALAIGVVVGSWSSIALAPSLLIRMSGKRKN